MAPRPAPHRRLTPEALAAALAPAVDDLERALKAAPPALLAAWRARLGPAPTDPALRRGLAEAAVYAALLARHRPPAGWLDHARTDLADLLDRTDLARRLDDLPDGAPALANALDFHLFEHLLAARDPAARASTGAYYTPHPLVHAQVALTGSLLRELGLGWTHPSVRVLDPASGTGIYPRTIAARVADPAALARNLHAYELSPGPAIAAHGHLTAAGLPAPHIHCRDTLRTLPELSPGETLVCIGNPPYSRHAPRAAAGDSLLHHFLPPAGAGIHIKNLYNDYVYFWHWAAVALARAPGPGVVCFVTAASYLRGPGFNYMRRHLRAVVDDLWILDLGGDSLGPIKTPNIFKNVRIPVCVGLAVRRGPRPAGPASIHYTRLPDPLDRDERLALLAGIDNFADLEWTRVDADDAFVPRRADDPATWPRLVDLFPWQHSGAQFKRTWPVGETPELLERRWRAMLASPDRAAAFHETRDRTIDRTAPPLPDPARDASTSRSLAHDPALATTLAPPLADLPADAAPPPILPYAWRSFDRRWCLADARLGDFLRPQLWHTRGDRQIFLTSLLSADTPSCGPAIVATAHIPDLHHYSGRGGADVLPLYRDPAGADPNITAGLLPLLDATYRAFTVTPDDLCAYVYCVLAHPAYTATLRDPGPRVPLTRAPALFTAAVALGRELLSLHTFGARMNPGRRPSPTGDARCLAPISPNDYPQSFAHDPAAAELRVGDGRFAPVTAATWSYSVSGLRVLPSWLGYRMQRPRGRASSPLDLLRPARWTDAMTHELLELLWTLERSQSLHLRQAALFREILAAPRFTEADLPRPTPDQRHPPRGAGTRTQEADLDCFKKRLA